MKRIFLLSVLLAAVLLFAGCAEREPEEFRRFDALFPPKEKLRLPGQIF